MILDIGLTIAHALDPAVFAEDRLGFRPDDWQARLLRSTAPQVIVNNGRQTGESTTVAALATHTAIFGDGALVLLISPTLRQSVELGRKVVDCLSQRHLHPLHATARFCTRPALVHGAEIAESGGRTSGCVARRGPRLRRRNYVDDLLTGWRQIMCIITDL